MERHLELLRNLVVPGEGAALTKIFSCFRILHQRCLAAYGLMATIALCSIPFDVECKPEIGLFRRNAVHQVRVYSDQRIVNSSVMHGDVVSPVEKIICHDVEEVEMFRCIGKRFFFERHLDIDWLTP